MLLNSDRAYRVMEKLGLEALVGTTWQHVFYLTGFEPSMETLKSDAKAHQMYALTARDDPTSISLIVPTIDLFTIAQLPESGTLSVYTYGDYYVRVPQKARLGPLEEASLKLCDVVDGYTVGRYPTALDALSAALRDKGLLKMKIGVDEMGVPPEIWDKLHGLFDVIRAYDALTKVRMVKTGEEITRIRESTRITEEAYLDTLRNIVPGCTEQEIADVFNAGVRERGGRQALWLVGSGPEGALTDRPPTSRKIVEGDVVLFDIGCRYRGYYSDTARSIVVGAAKERLRLAYDACYAAEEAAIDLIAPGLAVAQVFNAAVSAAHAYGLPDYRRHHVGHGLGVYPYDPPSIRSGDETPLEEGMIVNVETPYYEVGFGGIQLEDTLLVTANGREYITTLSRELFELSRV